MNNLGSKLRKARENKEFSQEYVADRLQVSVSSICRLEKNPSESKLGLVMKYAELLEIKLKDLLCEDGIPDFRCICVSIQVDKSSGISQQAINAISHMIIEDLKNKNANGSDNY